MDESLGPPRKRRRPALSCVECRRRKIKCDRDYPCEHCKRNGSNCTFTDAVPSMGDHALNGGPGFPTFLMTSHSSPTRQDDRASVPHGLPTPSSSHDVATIETEGVHSAVASIRNAPSSDVDAAEETIQSLKATIRLLEQTPPSSRVRDPVIEGEHLSPDLPPPVNGLRPLRANILKTRLLGPTHWISTFGQVRLRWSLKAVKADSYSFEPSANWREMSIRVRMNQNFR